ncbi:unnamed protein product [Lampetra planeri]
MKCIKVKCEEAIVEREEVKGKCEDVMVKSEDVKVKCEDEDSTPKSDLHIDGGNVKQEENSDCEAERGTSQEFVEVEVWVDFLDKTKSNEDPVDVATTNENRLVIQQWRERASHRAVSYRERDTAPSATKNAPPCRQLPRAAKRRQAPPLTSLRRKSRLQPARARGICEPGSNERKHRSSPERQPTRTDSSSSSGEKERATAPSATESATPRRQLQRTRHRAVSYRGPPSAAKRRRSPPCGESRGCNPHGREESANQGRITSPTHNL